MDSNITREVYEEKEFEGKELAGMLSNTSIRNSFKPMKTRWIIRIERWDSETAREIWKMSNLQGRPASQIKFADTQLCQVSHYFNDGYITSFSETVRVIFIIWNTSTPQGRPCLSNKISWYSVMLSARSEVKS
jgi:hypothetical protein